MRVCQKYANPPASVACGSVTTSSDQHDDKACCLPAEPTCWVSQPKQSGCVVEENDGGFSH